MSFPQTNQKHEEIIFSTSGFKKLKIFFKLEKIKKLEKKRKTAS